MSARRLLVGVAVAAVLLVPAVAAVADPAPPVGVGVATATFFDRSNFRVPAWRDAPGATINSVQATLRDGSNVVGPAHLTETSAGSGFWSEPDALKLVTDGGDMPGLGRYTIDITATDSQGNTTLRHDAGTLDFTLRPQFRGPSLGQPALTFDRTVSGGHATTAAKGFLEGLTPGTNTAVPISGAEVSVTRSYPDTTVNRTADATVTATTGSDGSFTTSDFTLIDGANFTASYSAADDQVDGAASGWGAPTVVDATAYVTAVADRAYAEDGQTLTVSGTVRNGPAATSPAMPGVVVGVRLSYQSAGHRTLATTNANGHFSVGVPVASGYGVNNWSVDALAPFVQGSAYGEVSVAEPVAYTNVHMSLAASGRVSATAILEKSYEVGQDASYEYSHLEYSPNGVSGWRNLAAAKNTYLPTTTVAAWGYARGYYRLYHYANSALGHAYSAPVFLSRTVTRVVSIHASPGTVRKGRSITVTGALQEYRSGWRAMRARTVDLYFRPSGAKTFGYVRAGRTDSHGRVRIVAKPTRSGQWLLQYFGDGTQFDGNSAAASVRVR